MATSDKSLDSVEQRPGAPVTRMGLSRYDIVLAVIPTIFVIAILLGHLVSVSLQTAVAFGSLLGVVAVVDALFVNPPRPGEK
jgi:hypothetical protein